MPMGTALFGTPGNHYESLPEKPQYPQGCCSDVEANAKEKSQAYIPRRTRPESDSGVVFVLPHTAGTGRYHPRDITARRGRTLQTRHQRLNYGHQGKGEKYELLLNPGPLDPLDKRKVLLRIIVIAWLTERPSLK